MPVAGFFDLSSSIVRGFPPSWGTSNERCITLPIFNVTTTVNLWFVAVNLDLILNYKDTNIGNSFAMPQAKKKELWTSINIENLGIVCLMVPYVRLTCRSTENLEYKWVLLLPKLYLLFVWCSRDLPWSPYVFGKANYVNEPQGCDIFIVLSTFTHINTFLLMLRWDIRGIASFVWENVLCKLTKFPFAIYFTVNEKRTTSNCGKNSIITSDNEFQICFKYTF